MLFYRSIPLIATNKFRDPPPSLSSHTTKLIARLVVPALQSIWFYNTQSDVWYEHFLTKRSGNNKPSSLIIRCAVSCIQSSYLRIHIHLLTCIFRASNGNMTVIQCMSNFDADFRLMKPPWFKVRPDSPEKAMQRNGSKGMLPQKLWNCRLPKMRFHAYWGKKWYGKWGV